MLKAKEAAHVMNIPLSTFYRYAESGRLPFPHYKIGNVIRVMTADVKSYLQTGQRVERELVTA